MVTVTHDSRTLIEARRVLDRVDVRLLLSVLIIASLLPMQWVHAMDPLFLLLFGTEFVVRALLVFRGRWHDPPGVGDDTVGDERRWPPPGQLALLVLDFFALVSFLPLHGFADARWLRLFRLTRMLALIGYWAPLLLDVWSVMLRRERARQVVLMGVIVLGLSFVGAVVMEYMADSGAGPIDYDGDGKLTQSDRAFFAHLWWAFRQVQDPGNMVQSPNHTIAVLVSIGLTVFGLFLVSFLIGLGTDVVRELMEISRLRGPGLRGHTVIINMNPSTRQLLNELIRYYRKLLPEGGLSWRWFGQLYRNAQRTFSGPRYVVVGRRAEPPDFLRHPDLARIIYRQGTHDDDEMLIERTDIRTAQRVVLLADITADDPDAETIRGLLTVVESLRDGPVPSAELPHADGHETRFTRRNRPPLLIAEILDESNVPAARAAIATKTGHTHAFVVPTERLIALFVACVARRSRIGPLLEELLSSHGHEVYTCFFDVPGLRYSRPEAPPLPNSLAPNMRYLTARALSLPPSRRALPVGLLVRPTRHEVGAPELRVVINPQGAHDDAQGRCCGFVAISSNFPVVRDFAEDLHEYPGTVEDPLGELPGSARVHPNVDEAFPALRRAPMTPLHRVLVCGFRSATVSMIEALIRAEPTAEILVLLADDDALAAALDDFDAHTNLVRNRLLTGHGVFLPEGGEHTLRFAMEDDDGTVHTSPRGGRVHLRKGNFTSSRRLMNLPAGFGHISSMDVVILISSEKDGSDARTTQALMKIETLSARAATGNASAQQIIAEVLDGELARRLRRHYAKLEIQRVKVYSIQTLRAFFMFQSVVVPSFDLVYAELLGPWGQSFVRLEPRRRGLGCCSYQSLSARLARKGMILIAVELESPAHDGQTVLHVGEGEPGRGESIDLERLRSAWVICDDARMADGRTPARSPSLSGMHMPAEHG
ncbi:MAG: ion transporter [Myxococcales bacterium]|nr:ion transporter [Myxococcales bacterium]MCB9751972.1 ion transporter [Myxococcales bacterium]